MLNIFFPILNFIDASLANWCPLVARVMAWGAVSGAGVMGMYYLVSDQKGIATLKNESRKARRQMLTDDIEYSEYMALTRRNLVLSFSLLGKTLLPSIVSSVVVVIVLFWVAAYHSYEWRGDATAINIDAEPSEKDLVFSPPEAFSRNNESVMLVKTDSPTEIEIRHRGKLVYLGTPANPATKRVRKWKWWNLLVGNVAGYIETNSDVEKIEMAFARKVIVPGVPLWAGTWEAPFFIAVTVFAFGIKFIFRIR